MRVLGFALFLFLRPQFVPSSVGIPRRNSQSSTGCLTHGFVVSNSFSGFFCFRVLRDRIQRLERERERERERRWPPVMRASSTERFLASLSRRRILPEMETQPASVPVSARETEQDVEEEEESPKRTSETAAQQQRRDKIQATTNRVNASQVLDGEFADPLEEDEERGEMATLAQVLFFFSIDPRGIFLSYQSLGFRV